MIQLNRIGNKLGAVGLFAVLLSGGMVVNQMVSESTINSANHRAGMQQTIAGHTLEGNVALRGMELAVRDIRLSKNPSELDKGSGGLNDARRPQASYTSHRRRIVANWMTRMSPEPSPRSSQSSARTS